MMTSIKAETLTKMAERAKDARAERLADELRSQLRRSEMPREEAVSWVVSSSGTLTMLIDFAAGTWEEK